MELKRSRLLDLGCELGEKSRVCLGAAISVCLAFGISSKAVAGDDDQIDHIQVTGSLLGRVTLAGIDPRPYSTSTGDSVNYSDLQQRLDAYDSQSTPSCETMKSNPIDYSTGNKIENELDFSGGDYEMPLYLSRTYNAMAGGTRNEPGILGGWVSSLDDRYIADRVDYLDVGRPGGGSKKYQWDGGRIYYIPVGGDPEDDDPNKPWVDFIEKDQNGPYIFHTKDGGTETYDGVTGKILEVKNSNGVKWVFNYLSGKLQRVTHSSGRFIQLNWQNNKLTSINDAAGNTYLYSYDANGALQSVTLPGSLSTVVTYHYQYGRLTGKSFNGQRYSYFEYTPGFGAATASYHAGGVNKTTFSYVENGHWIEKVTETTPLGQQIIHNLEDRRELTTSVQQTAHCSGGFAQKTYDLGGALSSAVDFNGNTTLYKYSRFGQLLEKTEASGTPFSRKTVNLWHVNSHKLLRTTLVGVSQTDYTYDPKNRVTSVSVTNLSQHGVAGQVRSTTYVYTEHTNGMVATKTVDGPISGAGDAVIYTYNSMGDLQSVQNSLGHTVSYSNYDANGRPGRIVGANGETTDYFYDPRGRIVKIRVHVNGMHADTDYAYNGEGLLSGVTTPDGVVTNYIYDAARRLLSEKRNVAGVLANGASFEEKRYTYNSNSDVTSVSTYADTVLVGVEYTDYDEQGRVRAKRGNNGQNIRYTYDPNGNLKTIKDSLDRVTTYTYDPLDRLSVTTDPLNGQTKVEYDAADRISKVTDPRGLITAYVNDGFGQLWAQNSPDTGTTTHQYNAAGQRTLATRNDGSTLSYVYDNLGRLTWYGTSLEARGFSYDWCANGKGRVCSAEYSGGANKYYTYTPQGLIQTTNDWTPANGGNGVAYSYDNMGRLAGMAYPNGDSVGYGYSAGKLVLVNAVTAGGVAHNVVNNIRYLPYGNAVSYNYGNGLTRNLYYDQNLNPGDLRLTGLTTMNGGTTLQSLLMGYNSNELITSITNFANQNLNQSYSYDTLSRLSGMASTAGNETIQYDATGNRTMHSWLAPIANDVDPASNRILRDYVVNGSGINYTHDARGNRASQSWNGSTATYSYGAFNQLTSVSRSAPTTYHNNAYALMTYPAGTTTYAVNALDQRIAKSNSTTTVRYVYTGQNQLVAENNNGQWTSHIWIGGEPVGFIRGGAMHWTHTDHLSRPELVTNAVKQVVWRAKNFHSERGVTLDSVGGYNLGLPGQYFDAETGLWHNGFRYYDSRLGRYTQSDPIGLAGGINTYAYAIANPVSLIDPSGLEWRYNSATGDLYHNDTYVATGYAGQGVGLNNPLMQSEPNTGPLPTGRYTIGPQYDSPNTGRATMALTPAATNVMYGRSAFRIHGDNRWRNQTASEGCMIFDRAIRDQIANSGDTDLVVENRSLIIVPIW